jgi:hypothetical protein
VAGGLAGQPLDRVEDRQLSPGASRDRVGERRLAEGLGVDGGDVVLLNEVRDLGELGGGRLDLR